MTKLGMVFLMLATLLVSCSDYEKTGSEQSVASDSAKVDSDALARVASALIFPKRRCQEKARVLLLIHRRTRFLLGVRQ